MAELEFTLDYEGPALADHEMDARDFANAVLSAAVLFKEMNRLVYPETGDLSVNIVATSPGSFDVLLKLINDTDQALLTSQVTALNNLSGLVNSFVAVVRLVRRKHTAQVVNTESVSPDTIRYTYDDGQGALEVPVSAIGLSERVSVRRDLAQITRPLNANGVEELVIRQEEIVVERVTKADLPAIEATPTAPTQPSALLHSNDREVQLVIVALSFKPGNKWRFSDSSDGDLIFSAEISDGNFLERVANREEAFHDGDQLRVVLRETQRTDTQGKLRTDREIVSVVEHLTSTTPGQLFTDDDA